MCCSRTADERRKDVVVGKEKSLQLKLVWFSDRKRREGDLRVEVVVVITGSFSCGMCAKAIIRSRGRHFIL